MAQQTVRSGQLSVLLIAEACNPTWTSVPLVGYQFARALAAQPNLRVTVVTHVRNREGLRGDPLTHLARMEYIDTEWLTGPLFRVSNFLRGGKTLSWTTGTALAWPAYLAFEQAIWRRFRHQLQKGAFDLIHRVTPLSPTIPSPLATWTETPMLVGPLNGGLPWPVEYPELRRQEREWLVPLRDVYRRLPFYRSSYGHLAGVIAGSRHTATEVPRWFRGKRFHMEENGVDPTRFPIAEGWTPPGKRFRFITVGRLVPYKAVDITLEAMARSSTLRDCDLEVIGDGPERARLEELARGLGLADRVTFPGWLPQAEVGARLGRAQAFVFPSLREFGGGVVLEAMASGLPPIVVDHGGPAELTGDCGLVLPLLPRPALIERVRAAMESLASDCSLAQRLGEAGCSRVREEFTWGRKANRLVAMYHEVLNGRRPVSLPAIRFDSLTGRRGQAGCSTRFSSRS